MKLKTLNLANFRGYDQLTLQLDPELTVIAGVNGVGKSSLLNAITHFASELLPKVTANREKSIGLNETDIKVGKDSLNISAEFATDDAQFFVDTVRNQNATPEEAMQIAKEVRQLRSNIRETKKGSIEEEALQDKIRILENSLEGMDNTSVRTSLIDQSFLESIPKDSPDRDTLVEEKTGQLVEAMQKASHQPLVVYYSTSRLLSRLPPVMGKTKKIDIATAYVRSLEQQEVSLNEFANWYRVQQENPERSQTLFEQINQAVGTFLDHVSNIELHETKPPKFSVEKKGARFFLEQLSDGERGLLALVFDLARRLCIANPTSDAPLTEGKAIVLIDEIELHLHPKWQRMVVRKLREVFQACQFIITTHSPQVIGQVKPDKLRLLAHDEDERVVLKSVGQAYGMDSSWVLENIMGVPARDYETEQRLSTIYDAIDDDDLIEARNLANALKKDIGDFPDLQEAIALLDRFELLSQG